MKVGLFVTNQNYLEKDMVSALDEQFAMVRMARDKGWDSLFTGQHYLNEGNNKQLQAVPFMARLQAEAGHMTCGLGILLIPIHNPVYIAETIASLDVICRGNFIFGVGMGYVQKEFDAFRVPIEERVKRFNSHLALIKRLWSEESVTYEDASTKLVNVRMNIRPVQKPHPPIWVAANQDVAVRRAARVGDAWMLNPHATLETLVRQMAIFREERKVAKLGTAHAVPCVREIVCARSKAEALELAGPYLAAKYQAYTKWGQDDAMPGGDTIDQPLQQLIKDRFVIGSPDECYAELEPYWKQAGVNHLIFRCHWAGMPVASALQSMRMISEELLPALKKV
jgi:alkanesulfonate monooxygenase SsuD/methylene tetrahydromethanopterin reductase-like flavin-dependent oxidoreductase (luciferase family)